MDGISCLQGYEGCIMNFGFDIDDTLLNLREHAFNLYREKLNKHVPIKEFYRLTRVEIHEPFGLTDKEGKELWRSSLESIYYTDCPIFPGALETVKWLKREGHDIYYITARPSQHGERTKKWLSERDFPIDDGNFYYGMKDHEKITIINELNLDYYVDDKPTVLKTLLDSDTTLLLKDQSYNRNFTEAIRLYDWYELKELLDTLP